MKIKNPFFVIALATVVVIVSIVGSIAYKQEKHGKTQNGYKVYLYPTENLVLVVDSATEGQRVLHDTNWDNIPDFVKVNAGKSSFSDQLKTQDSVDFQKAFGQ